MAFEFDYRCDWFHSSGGVNSLVGYNRKDIEEKFKKVEHSSAAEYLLNEYKLRKHELEKDSYIFDESLEVNNLHLKTMYFEGNFYWKCLFDCST